VYWGALVVELESKSPNQDVDRNRGDKPLGEWRKSEVPKNLKWILRRKVLWGVKAWVHSESILVELPKLPDAPGGKERGCAQGQETQSTNNLTKMPLKFKIHTFFLFN
jgi:hypothetical protein